MADYSKQTVAQLRQVLKDRGIPSTGLQRKAQIIEKLQEDDEADAGAEGQQDEEEADAEPESATVAASSATVGHLTDSDASQPNTPKAIETTSEDATVEEEPGILKAIETNLEDATVEEEPGTLQPAQVLNAPSAGSEEGVSPRITAPVDVDTQNADHDKVADDELPDAPAPAAEALPHAKGNMEQLKKSEGLSREQNTASPALNEKQSIEKPELLPIPERSTAETSRLNTEELEADTRKRKRRSNTPELPTQDVKAKKHRPSQEPAAPEIHLQEDEHVVMEEDVAMQDAGDLPTKQPIVEPEKEQENARYTEPASHHATSALYIRNFMRPLRPQQLREHLVSLATPPDGSPDPSAVVTLFLDDMKTHALVSFTSTTVASRVRASLHGTIWPPEANRKELWADFIPSEHISAWIAEEQEATHGASRSSAPKRFEVVYPESSDGIITAVFRTVMPNNAPANPPRGPRSHTDIDTRRPSTQATAAAAPPPETRQKLEASFKTLDELFRSTKAKPQLYFLAVPEDTAAQRLKDLEADTSRDWAAGETRKGRGIKTESKFRYSFDTEGRVVEGGMERGGGFVGRGRGGWRGRGGGGGGRGGYRGRGGDAWRA